MNNLVAERALRELYLAPFEAIVENARPWGIMTAYNTVNGTTMTEHRDLVNEVLRGEWGFDGVNVSDWTAARDTVRRPRRRPRRRHARPRHRLRRGPRRGRPRRARSTSPTVDDGRTPRAAARRPRRHPGGRRPRSSPTLPADRRRRGAGPRDRPPRLRPASATTDGRGRCRSTPGVARSPLIGAAARDARVLGGGSATVFPDRGRLPARRPHRRAPRRRASPTPSAPTPPPNSPPPTRASRCAPVCRDADGDRHRHAAPPPNGQIQWMGTDLPEGVTHDAPAHRRADRHLHPARERPRTPSASRALGAFTLTVGGTTYYDDVQRAGDGSDPFEAFFGAPRAPRRGRADRGRAASRSPCTHVVGAARRASPLQGHRLRPRPTRTRSATPTS